jgi:hypothetical protein
MISIQLIICRQSACTPMTQLYLVYSRGPHWRSLTYLELMVEFSTTTFNLLGKHP